MIETRRLKNVVIFTQTMLILFFMLALTWLLSPRCQKVSWLEGVSLGFLYKL